MVSAILKTKIMIDKKKLIEELLDCVADATDTETQITSLKIAGMLMNEVLDKSLNIAGVMHWVSVLDNLPPVEKSVLVYDCFRIYISNRLDENGISWDKSEQILDEVTHWMHLPTIPCA
jgi:hypothetical protein